MSYEDKLKAGRASLEKIIPKIHDYLANFYESRKAAFLSHSGCHESMSRDAHFHHPDYVLHGFAWKDVASIIENLVDVELLLGCDLASRIRAAGKVPLHHEVIHYDIIRSTSKGNEDDGLNLTLIIRRVIECITFL